MKAYEGSGYVAPCILNLDIRWGVSSELDFSATVPLGGRACNTQSVVVWVDVRLLGLDIDQLDAHLLYFTIHTLHSSRHFKH